jgi:hypothetical protein
LLVSVLLSMSLAVFLDFFTAEGAENAEFSPLKC